VEVCWKLSNADPAYQHLNNNRINYVKSERYLTKNPNEDHLFIPVSAITHMRRYDTVRAFTKTYVVDPESTEPRSFHYRFHKLLLELFQRNGGEVPHLPCSNVASTRINNLLLWDCGQSDEQVSDITDVCKNYQTYQEYLFPLYEITVADKLFRHGGEKCMRFIVHPSEKERMERIQEGTNNPMWDLVQVLRYTPGFGTDFVKARSDFYRNTCAGTGTLTKD